MTSALAAATLLVAGTAASIAMTLEWTASAPGTAEEDAPIVPLTLDAGPTAAPAAFPRPATSGGALPVHAGN